MSKMLQVRNVPDDVHAALVAQARDAGMSLSEYVGRELLRLAAAPSLAELERRAVRRASRMTFQQAADLVRADRDARA
jgi:antitoxin FitA